MNSIQRKKIDFLCDKLDIGSSVDDFEIDESKKEFMFNCPLCHIVFPDKYADTESHMNYNYDKDIWHCWRCDSAGATVVSLLVATKEFDKDSLWKEYKSKFYSGDFIETRKRYELYIKGKLVEHPTVQKSGDQEFVYLSPPFGTKKVSEKNIDVLTEWAEKRKFLINDLKNRSTVLT